MKTSRDDNYWRQKLTSEQYRVLREKGTEIPFSGKFWNNKTEGMYQCAACGAPLFKSSDKYESNQPGLEGWPSFAEVANSDAVKLIDDNSYGMHRVEVTCANCGSHLGHVFDDSSSPTNQHYCVNSVCLAFQPKPENGPKNT